MSFHKEENNNFSDFKNAVLWKLVVLLINWERKYTSYVIKRFTSVPAFLGNYPVTFTDHFTLCARHCDKCFSWITSFNTHYNSVGWSLFLYPV